MKLKHLGLAAAGLLSVSTIAFAAGIWPDFPIVGSASYCAGTSASATGTMVGAITGCPNTVPAGPTIVTGNEQIPADTRLSGGAAPQTVLLPMASLNALPIIISKASVSGGVGANLVSATNTQGGIVLWGAGAYTNISTLNVSMPPSPIDGQQFVIGSNLTIATLSVLGTTPTLQSVANTPTVLTVSTTTGAQGYRFIWNAATSTWYRLN